VVNAVTASGASMVATTETATVEKPADEDEHAGHHHGHAH
jgi:chaperonin GroEL